MYVLCAHKYFENIVEEWFNQAMRSIFAKTILHIYFKLTIKFFCIFQFFTFSTIQKNVKMELIRGSRWPFHDWYEHFVS